VSIEGEKKGYCCAKERGIVLGELLVQTHQEKKTTKAAGYNAARGRKEKSSERKSQRIAIWGEGGWQLRKKRLSQTPRVNSKSVIYARGCCHGRRRNGTANWPEA
jgi:hypothetical protein